MFIRLIKEVFSRMIPLAFYAMMVAATAFSIESMVDDISKRDMEQLKFDTAFFGVEATFVIVISYMIIGDYVIVIKRRVTTATNPITKQN